MRFGRVPKREKARILAAMQQSTLNRGQRHLPGSFPENGGKFDNFAGNSQSFENSQIFAGSSGNFEISGISGNFSGMSDNFPAENLDDPQRLLAAVVRAHMDTCEFTREKVQQMRQKARQAPSYSQPTMVFN